MNRHPYGRFLLALALTAAPSPGGLADEEKQVAQLIEELGSDDGMRWAEADAAVRRLGSVALPALRTAITQHKSPGVRESCVTLAAEIAPDDPSVRTALKAALKDPDPWVRLRSAYHIRESRRLNEDVPILLATVRAEKDGDLRLGAAFRLARVADSETAVTAILLAFRGSDRVEVRQGMSLPGTFHTGLSFALAEVGQTGVPLMAQALRDKDPLVRAGAARALGSVAHGKDFGASTKDIVPEIAALLADKDVRVRREAAGALTMIATESGRAFDPLAQGLHDPDPEVRMWCARALGRAGSAAVPTLIEALRDKDSDARKEVAYAIGRTRTKSKTAIEALVRVLEEDKSPHVRSAAAGALGDIGPAAAAAVPGLISALRSDDPFLQWRAACSLGKIGPAARAAVPALQDTLHAKDKILGEAAEKALSQIQPGRER